MILNLKSFQEKLSIRPNPVQHEMIIENGKGQATIYNLLGQPIWIGEIVNSSIKIDTSEFTKGQYILVVRKENDKYSYYDPNYCIRTNM